MRRGGAPQVAPWVPEICVEGGRLQIPGMREPFENQMEMIGKALESYYAENGSWPSAGPSSIAAILQGSVSQKDPWDKDYRYFFSNDGYAIQSSGPDQVFAEGQKYGRDDHWYSKSLREKR